MSKSVCFFPLLYQEPCAIMPPLELFMEVSYDERRAMLYRDLERGDVVVGRINNIREYGFFLTLLCTAVGLKRDIEDLELSVGLQDKFVLYTVKAMSRSLNIKKTVYHGSDEPDIWMKRASGMCSVLLPDSNFSQL